MIFKDKLIEKESLLEPEFENLFNTALKNQDYPTDLLLVHINGFYNSEIDKCNEVSEKKFNPHVIGPGPEGHAEDTHYRFINNYRHSYIYKETYPAFLKLIEDYKADNGKYDELINLEELSIQLEMLVYLKLWESDSIIKKFYQLAKLLNGERYDWYFKIADSSRDTDSTGVRHEIIRKLIRDGISAICPVLSDTIRNTYKSQIRNTIAHSKFHFLGRSILLNTYIEKDEASQLKSLTFDDWYEIFHNTLMIQNQYIGLDTRINRHFGGEALKNENTLPIRITEKSGETYELAVIYRPEFEDWHYKQK